MNTNDLIKDFRKWWLNQGHSKYSASSYVSYIRKAIEIFNNFKPVKDNGLDTFLTCQEIVTRSGRDDNKITRDIKILFRVSLKESGNSLGAKKTYSNALSGLVTFFNYMYLKNYHFEHDTSTAKRVQQALVDSNSKNIIFKYTPQEVYSNFNSRINTQDRVYDHIILNFVAINTILKLDKTLFNEYQKMKKDKILSTKFIIDPKSKASVPLSDIKQLTIKPVSECIIEDNNNVEHLVYTEGDPFDKSYYEPLKPMDIQHLSIDHDNTMNDLFGLKYYEYPNIIKLSEMIGRYFSYSGNDYKEIKAKIDNLRAPDIQNIISNEQIDSSFSKLILEDLKKLYSRMGYSIMYGPYNSKKSG